MPKEIGLPYNGWLPRTYQEPYWDAINSDKYKRALHVWHRRAGKDLVDLNFIIKKACTEPGVYWYMFPEYKQGRRAIWEGITREGVSYMSFFPKEFMKGDPNQTEMKVEFKNGSIFRIVGADSTRNVGAGPRGVVFSEYSLTPPSIFDYVEPMLLENDGWAVFNFTPRGENHAYDLLKMAEENPKWYSEVLDIRDTGIITEEQINDIRKRGAPEEIVQQEYYCSFEGAIHGSYYGDIIKMLDKKEQITAVPYDTGAMVHTYWDLGIDDCTSIWFIQSIGREHHIIDYYENNNQNLSFYADLLLNVKDYTYGSHNLPHDGARRELGGGRIDDQLKKLGLTNVKVHPRTPNIYNGIQALRALLSTCWIDKANCKAGIEAVKHYRRDWDEKTNTYKTHPLHDWSSHGADALRLFAETFKIHKQRVARTTQATTGGVWDTGMKGPGRY